MEAALIVVAALAVLVLIGLAASVRVLREYERGVIFRLGRLIDQRGPGLILLIPVIDRMVRVDLRVVTMNVPPQEVITRDNVPARVNAVVYFRVMEPNKAIVEVENFVIATSQIAQTTLRSVLGKAELDTLLAERDRLNTELQQIIDDQTEPWGIKVAVVEIKDVEIPEQMQRAMARQAEAERERRAKVINAEGEFQASERLFQAAEIISRNPATLQLRYLQTLIEVGVNQNSTIVFPLPIDLIKPLMEAVGATTGTTPPALDDSDMPTPPPIEGLHGVGVAPGSSVAGTDDPDGEVSTASKPGSEPAEPDSSVDPSRSGFAAPGGAAGGGTASADPDVPPSREAPEQPPGGEAGSAGATPRGPLDPPARSPLEGRPPPDGA